MVDKSSKIAAQMQDTAQACEVLGLPEVKTWCSTGCTTLDLGISNMFPGGMPIGRIIQVYGGASTAKSVLATTLLGYALRSGMHAFYADIEHTLDPKFAKIYGLDCSHENFYYGYSWEDPKKVQDQPGTIEEFFDSWVGGILDLRTRKPKVLVVDSITALPAAYEVDKEMTKQGFGAYRAKSISLGLRKYISLLVEKGVTLVCIDQTRDNVGSAFSGEVTTGGRGLEFYSSVRLYLKHAAKVKNSSEKEIGIWVKWEIAKNKVGPPFRKGKFKILFDYGLDDVTSNLSFLAQDQKGIDPSFRLTTKVEIGICSKCGSFQYEEGGCQKQGCDGTVEKMSKRIMDWVSLVEKEGHEDELKNIVAQSWADSYRTEDRKPRTW